MAINYNYETDFNLGKESVYSDWVNRIIISEGYRLEELSFVFCDDSYLLTLNQGYLNHDTLTDIITFDYTDNRALSGDVFISIERVLDNAKDLKVSHEEELLRVMVHGVLHLMGYNDKTDLEAQMMRSKEDEKIEMFHVER